MSRGRTGHRSSMTYDEALEARGYTINGEIGGGSYAKVKKAHSTKSNCHVALKVIDQSRAPEDFLKKFMPREFEIHTRLVHQNIVQVLDLFRIGTRIYLAMELAGHGDLLDYVRLRGALSEPVAGKMFRQLVEGVKYLHENNIIHRDLKCENILLDPYNNVLIADFGFSRWMDTGKDWSQTYCGSAAYAAPEILRGTPYTGYGYDMWSLGVVLFILVCGSMPYDDSHLSKMIRTQLEHNIHFPSRIVDQLSAEVKALIGQLLHPEIRNRFTAAETVESDWLRQFPYRMLTRNGELNDESVSITVDQEHAPQRKSSRGRRGTAEANEAADLPSDRFSNSSSRNLFETVAEDEEEEDLSNVKK